jgi:hypothetical protein
MPTEAYQPIYRNIYETLVKISREDEACVQPYTAGTFRSPKPKIRLEFPGACRTWLNVNTKVKSDPTLPPGLPREMETNLVISVNGEGLVARGTLGKPITFFFTENGTDPGCCGETGPQLRGA